MVKIQASWHYMGFDFSNTCSSVILKMLFKAISNEVNVYFKKKHWKPDKEREDEWENEKMGKAHKCQNEKMGKAHKKCEII